MEFIYIDRADCCVTEIRQRQILNYRTITIYQLQITEQLYPIGELALCQDESLILRGSLFGG